ncbi:hypothetical protein [Flavihumibacter fluvii]|nr:hypothetical protein [Flavihumibacter fluvii]
MNFGGVTWHELDPVYPIILFLDWLGIIQVKKDSLKRIEVEF